MPIVLAGLGLGQGAVIVGPFAVAPRRPQPFRSRSVSPCGRQPLGCPFNGRAKENRPRSASIKRPADECPPKNSEHPARWLQILRYRSPQDDAGWAPKTPFE